MKPDTAHSAGVRPLTHNNVRKVENVSPDNIYAAGLFEGEGCVSIRRARGRSGNFQVWLVALVKMSDPEPIAFLHERWGGRLHMPRIPEGRRPLTEWCAHANIAAAFLADIYPYLLSERRREAARLGMEFQAQKTRSSQRYELAYAERQETYRGQMKALNARAAA